MPETPTIAELVANGIPSEGAVQTKTLTSDHPAASSEEDHVSEQTSVQCKTSPEARPARMSASEEHSQLPPSQSHNSELAEIPKEIQSDYRSCPEVTPEAAEAGPVPDVPEVQTAAQVVQSAEGGSRTADSQSIEKPLQSVDLTVSFIRVSNF